MAYNALDTYESIVLATFVLLTDIQNWKNPIEQVYSSKVLV